VSWRSWLLGLLAFLVALVAVLPARWIGGLVPSAVQCQQWRGTLWRGRCRQLTVSAPQMQAVTLETVGWTLHPLPLLRGRLSAEVTLTDARGDAAGHLEFTHKGLLVLRGVSARVLVDPALPTAMPAGWRGRVELGDLEVDWQSNQLRHLQGELRFLDLRDEQGRLLGNFNLSFPPSTAPPFAGQLSDAGGPFDVRAVLTLSADRHWNVQGTVAARSDADPGLTRFLELLGAPDSDGRYPLAMEGSFQ